MIEVLLVQLQQILISTKNKVHRLQLLPLPAKHLSNKLLQIAPMGKIKRGNQVMKLNGNRFCESHSQNS